jgi:uncharacterized heparinase superfamily protein
VVIDAGAAPPLELAQVASAGCLSFELSTGDQALLVNAGAPRLADAGKRSLARATANHNTLCLNEQSSSKLIRNPRLERQLGNPPLAHPDRVTCEVRQLDECVVAEMTHDGYVDRFGLVHTRRLRLDATGRKLEGKDTLSEASSVMRFAWDLPFAVHFHLHPAVSIRIMPTADSAELMLASGEQWRLTAAGAALTIEQSTHFADNAGPISAQQVVLRGTCNGAARASWTLERIRQGFHRT